MTSVFPKRRWTLDLHPRAQQVTLIGYTNSERVIGPYTRGPPFTPAVGAHPAPSPDARALTPDRLGRALVAINGQAMADGSQPPGDLPISAFLGPRCDLAAVIWEKMACSRVPVCAMGVDCSGTHGCYGRLSPSSPRGYALCRVRCSPEDPENMGR